jgi:hypothetical protein
VIKKLSELKPYKSLLLARVQGSTSVKNIVDNLLEDLTKERDGCEVETSFFSISAILTWILALRTSWRIGSQAGEHLRFV